MPHATATDGVKLYYEEAGSGTPLLFVHEFAGDYRSWAPQVRHFARRYRCIAYAARGYPPSDVPEDVAKYSQARARDDIRDLLDHLRIERAHLCGLSMGGFAVLHVGLAYPERARSLVVGGCGYGAAPDRREQFQHEAEAAARMFSTEGGAAAAEVYASGPTRLQFLEKDPHGYAEFKAQLAEHDPTGAALTMLGVQRHRPSLWELQDNLRRLQVPTLVITGDEDDPCLEPALMLKRTIPTAGLVVLPKAGHTINLEEPDLFNAAVQRFLTTVDAGRWSPRDPRTGPDAGILGVR
jgi:pimeloyl-ACP methyl ester carboxylesterase